MNWFQVSSSKIQVPSSCDKLRTGRVQKLNPASARPLYANQMNRYGVCSSVPSVKNCSFDGKKLQYLAEGTAVPCRRYSCTLEVVLQFFAISTGSARDRQARDKSTRHFVRTLHQHLTFLTIETEGEAATVGEAEGQVPS